MKIRFIGFLVYALALVLLPASVWAISIDTVDWAPDATLDGAGTGTLAGSSIAVTYLTVVGQGNSGTTIGDNWNTSLATDGAVGTGVTHTTGGVFGTISAVQPTVILFTANVTNPILYVNFSDANTSLDFVLPILTFLDSNNAQLSGGSLVTFTGSTNGFHDGFAARVSGTFGPSTIPLIFNYLSTTPGSHDSVGFTIGLPLAVPEPSSMALMVSVLGLLGMTAGLRRVRGKK